MMGISSKKYYASSLIWGGLAKIIDAGIKFITIPILLNYFGELDFGLLTLAIATNAYMQLLDMGINTGAVRFFSQWLASGNNNLLNRVARTNISFYLAIGVLNSIVLIVLAFKSEAVFNITQEQSQTFRYLLFILAGVSIVNWTTMVFNQLLIADEKIAFTQKVLTVKAILNLILVILTTKFELTILQYFAWLSILNVSVLFPYLHLSKRRNLIHSFIPAFFWKEFYVVFKYSMAIFAMSIFQYTAVQSRPIVLSIFSNEGTSILAQYRIIEVFPLFIISIGGILISILLPKSSKAVHENNRKLIEQIAYEGTKYSSILVSVLCFLIIINANDLLLLYIGEEYINLSKWLIMWCFTVVLFLHNSPIASLVLATGKTKMLVYSSAISCTVSIIINAVLCKSLGVGSAVIGYFVYIVIQICFYYLYFINNVLGLKPIKVFKSFIFPTIIGLLLVFIINNIKINFNFSLLTIIVKSTIWLILYFLLLILFKIINREQIKILIS